MMMEQTRLTFWIFIVMAILLIPGSLRAQDTVRYVSEDSHGKRLNYYVDVLKLALDKSVESHGAYELMPVEKDSATQLLNLKSMLRNEVDVVITMTNKTRELTFAPVRVPLTKGLIGIRLSIIKKEDAEIFDSVKTIDDLKKIRFVQGYDWPDTKIMKANDLIVETGENLDDNYRMLLDGNADALPRAAFEIWNELDERNNPQLIADDEIIIYFPAAMYFFVRKQDSDLQERLSAGMMKAVEDGSFDELFYREMQQHLDKSDLDNRVLIKLDNPFLSPGTPTDDDRLWHIPFSE